MLENDVSPTMANPTTYLKDYTRPDFSISKVDLDFKLGANTTIVTAKLQISKTSEHHKPLVLNGEKLDLQELKMNGQSIEAADYEVDKQSLTINSVPDKFSLTIVTQLQPHLNTELSGLYQSSGNFCTQCEAEGFRRITYFLDRPDVLSEYEVTLTADKASCPVLLANGNPVARGENSDGTHWHRWHDPHPKPSYLFALVAGDLQHISDSFTTTTGKQIGLNIYTQAHNIDQCDYAMLSLKNSMTWDEQVYGREYDLDVFNIVAVDDFNMGAMENKGLNIFNSKYVLADQESATDTDYQGIEAVIGHEYFHNWSGNRVTCRDWFQLSLKEGFTVFRDQEFSADMGSRGVKRILDVQTLRTYQFKEDAGPMAHPIRPDSYQEINNFYTVTIYEKGAEVIRMLHRLVGTQGFRKATDYYFDRFDGQAVTTEDFVRSIEQTNDIDLSQFRLWYSQAGTPQVLVKQQYDQGNGVLTLTLRQSCAATPGQSEKRAFQIPIAMALFDSKGKLIEEKTIVLTKAEQHFDFGDLVEQPVASLLRGFSAPIKMEFQQSNDELAHLIQHEDDGYAAWQAMQQLSLNLLLPAIKQGAVQNEERVFDEAAYQTLLRAFSTLLDADVEDKAILAEMLSLPGTAYLAEFCKPINPQRVVTIKESLVQRLANDLQSELEGVYLANKNNKKFSLNALAMAERKLKNTVLSFLLTTDKPKYYEFAIEQYHQASNMTDRLAAFVALIHSRYAEKNDLIVDFYTRWKNNTLVLDKWFAVQATTPDPQQDVLASVMHLMKHAAFSINNPNKVRSLIGAFTSNMRAFHRPDGAGYELLADIIIKLNNINPQIGARLVSTFNNWRAYDEPYSSNMRTQLERIKAQDKLSRDIAEIVSKALA